MDIKLSPPNNDITFANGDIEFIFGIAAVAQRVKDRIQTFRQEWFLDQDFGVNFFRDILKKNPSLFLVQSILKSQAELALNGEAVIKEFELTLEQATRILEVSFVLRDPETGEEVQEQVVIG